MGIFSKNAIRGAGYWVLQVLRVFTVITLLAATAACWVLMIKVDKGRSFFIFECISLFFTSVISMVLVVSEFPVLSFVKDYFRQAWPVLSEHYGVGWLGAAVMVIGCNILGSLNEPAYDAESLGPHFSSLVLAAGILCLIFGTLNVLGSLVWRHGQDGITSRDIRANGSLAEKHDTLPSSNYSARSASPVYREKSTHKETSRFSRFSIWGKKDLHGGSAGKRSIPTISGPMHTHDSLERNPPPPNYVPSPDPTHYEPKESPVAPGVMRPLTAEHPMMSSKLSVPPPALKPQHTGVSSVYSSDARPKYSDRWSLASYNRF